MIKLDPSSSFWNPLPTIPIIVRNISGADLGPRDMSSMLAIVPFLYRKKIINFLIKLYRLNLEVSILVDFLKGAKTRILTRREPPPPHYCRPLQQQQSWQSKLSVNTPVTCKPSWWWRWWSQWRTWTHLPPWRSRGSCRWCRWDRERSLPRPANCPRRTEEEASLSWSTDPCQHRLSPGPPHNTRGRSCWSSDPPDPPFLIISSWGRKLSFNVCVSQSFRSYINISLFYRLSITQKLLLTFLKMNLVAKYWYYRCYVEGKSIWM